ncbi:MAG: sulfatase-like hydrolase/transferase [Deltaproteobacteria bacterium]|nr:sulfatase-like hydrolase/transferase [Deltaproteobacteria bacterium]
MRSLQTLSLLAALAALVASDAAAAATTEVPLQGGRVGRVRGAGSHAAALFVFTDEPGVAALGDPRCPATSTVRLGFDTGDYRVTALPCGNWAATARGFVYDDPAASTGVRRIVLRPDRLQIFLSGPRLADIGGPVAYLDASLQVGSTRACGHFDRFKRNRAGRIVAARGSSTCALPRPNVLVINLDDTRADGIDRMPVLQSRLIGEGVNFSNSFVPNPLCCPSRASIFTGLYALHHGTRTLVPPIGGATTFRRTGADQQTIATWMHGAGYRTGLFGKYLNAYSGVEATAGPGGRFYVPPGWDRWQAMGFSEHYGGINGPTYQLVDEQGVLTTYADHTTDDQYSTDLLAQRIRDFAVESVSRGKNFFAVFTPYASHGDTPSVEPKPAQRHLNLFKDIPPWRPANFDEADVSDKPLWLQALPPSGPIGIAVDDLMRYRAYETLLSVDEQLALLLDQFDALGVGDDTIVILTSDNGVTWGEHGFFGQGKECPYEEAIRVPLAVRYPRRIDTAAPRVSAAPVLNIDVPVTVADLAGVSIPVPVDGAAFTGWLTGAAPATWRDDFLLEHWSAIRYSYLTWSGQPLDGDRVHLLYGPSVPSTRLEQAFEFDSGDGVDPGAIAVPIGADEVATYAALGAAVQASVPHTTYTINTAIKRLNINDTTPDYAGVQLMEDVDQANRFEPVYPLPDYFGVRDIANQYVYVEYGTGEAELYDLVTDPGEMENRADDPDYLGERIRLAARLRELLE